MVARHGSARALPIWIVPLATSILLAARGGWRERGYFDAVEHDAIEGLLLRMTTMRSAFWGEYDRLGGLELAAVETDAHPRAHLLVLHLGLALADSGSFIVSTFAGDEIAIAKIDEAYYRTAIQEGTYSRLRLGTTSRDRREQLAAAWVLHEEELSRDDSSLARLVATDPAAAALSAPTATLHARSRASRPSMSATTCRAACSTAPWRGSVARRRTN